MQRKIFYNDSVFVRCSVGLAHSQDRNDNMQPIELFQRDYFSLNAAKRFGGSRVEIWRPDLDGSSDVAGAELSGIFMGSEGGVQRD